MFDGVAGATHGGPSRYMYLQPQAYGNEPGNRGRLAREVVNTRGLMLAGG
jgi:hypothetical protein